MHDFKKAKKETKKKWRAILKGIPRLIKIDFCAAVNDATNCGFCQEWRSDIKRSICFWDLKKIVNPNNCPAFHICKEVVFTKMYEIEKKLQWRKPAAELCEWVLEEVERLEE